MAHIKSFNELGGGDSSDDDSSGPDKGTNEYYAGGAKSGQVVKGQKDDDPDKVASLFDRARAAGAQQGSASDIEAPSGAFRGTSNTLAGGPQEPPASGPTNHVIVFYRNGIFTVNDGPPRRVDDRANFAFIDSISKGECPDELEPGSPGAPVNVNLMRKDADYAEPEKPKMTAFTGAGNILAGSSNDAAAVAAAHQASSVAAAKEWEGVDESKPTTSLQLRLADGSRMVAKFNATHKVSDIRRFMIAAHPEMTLIEDETKTLEEAGLLNAVIIQKKV